jgi:2-oxoglutarate dehydrogenase E1 component
MPFRKPLIVFSPKSLLKLRAARSPLDDFAEGTRFQRLIPEDGPVTKNPSNATRLVFCSGKVYYALTAAREALGLTDKIAICRVEQISPFPYDNVREQCERYNNAELIWAQEEHKNMGAWSYVKPRLQTLLKMQREVQYAGRQTSSSPATGSKFQHVLEQRLMLSDVLGVPEDMLKDFH